MLSLWRPKPRKRKLEPVAMTTQRFLDTDESDAVGAPMFHYAGLCYLFEQEGRKASARRYDDRPHEVSINGFWPKQPPPSARPPKYIPYHDPFLAAVVALIRQEPGVDQVSFLCRNGYRNIDFDLLQVKKAKCLAVLPHWVRKK